jgi:hypothetical protein
VSLPTLRRKDERFSSTGGVATPDCIVILAAVGVAVEAEVSALSSIVSIDT